MAEPIMEISYWRERLQTAPADQRHLAIYRCSLDQWLRIEAQHRTILGQLISSGASVLDAGCGWGRLLGLLPKEWIGPYLGVDLSPDFISLARRKHPERLFIVSDLTVVESAIKKTFGGPWVFDWAILISIRPMVRRNLGAVAWATMETEIRQVARRLLYLEYDENDLGSVE